MAITFVGSKTFTHAATSAQSVSLTDLKDESNNNATLLENDYVIINYAISSNGVNRSNAAMTPSGYTEFIATDLYADDNVDTNQLVSYKKMGVTPDTTVDIPASHSTGAGVSGTIYAFRGVDQTTPSDVTPTTATGINTGIADCPSIEPITAGAWIVGHGAAGASTGANFTNPAGMSSTTNHFRSATIDPTYESTAGTCIKTDWISGAYDIAAFGGSSSSTAASWCATTIVLRPAAGGTTVTPPATELGITAYAPTATGDPTLFEYFPAGSAAFSSATAATSIAITSTPPIGANIGLLLMAFDNTGSGADGDYSEVTGVTDNKGNNWHKLAEHSNTNGAAGAGATVSVWYCEVDPNTFESTITTATLSSSIASRCAAMIYCRSETLSLYAAEVLTNAVDASASYGSLSTSLAAKNRLYLRVCAQETAATSDFSSTTNFTTLVNNVQVATMGLRAEHKIATSTSETSNPTTGASSDNASVFIALETDAPGGDGRQTAINTYSMTGVSNAADEVTQITAVSVGVNSSTTADEVTQITAISLGINVSTEDEVTQIVMYSITSQPIPTPPTTVLGITAYAPNVPVGEAANPTIPPNLDGLGISAFAPVVTASQVANIEVPIVEIGYTAFAPDPPIPTFPTATSTPTATPSSTPTSTATASSTSTSTASASSTSTSSSSASMSTTGTNTNTVSASASASATSTSSASATATSTSSATATATSTSTSSGTATTTATGTEEPPPDFDCCCCCSPIPGVIVIIVIR